MSEELNLQEGLHVEEELSPDHALSFREIFGSKMMSLGSADAMIRVVTGLGIAQIIVAVLLIGLNLVDWPTLPLMSDGTGISIPVLVGCTLFVCTAWCWLVVGALHSRLLIRIPLLLLFFAVHIALVGQSGQIVGWICLALGLSYCLWHSLARPAGYVQDLIVIGLGIAFLYIALVDYALLLEPTGEYVALIISLQIMALSLLLIPLFVFAGLDLGESVRDVTRWAIGQAASRFSDRVLVWLALGIAAAKTVWLVADGKLSWDWLVCGLVLVGCGWIAARMRPWEGLYHEPQFGLLAGMAFLTAVLFFVIAIAQMVGLLPETDNPGRWIQMALAVLAGGTALTLTVAGRTAGRRTAITFLSILSLWITGQFVARWLADGGVPNFSGTFLGDFGLDGALTVLVGVVLLILHARGLTNRSVAAWALSLIAGMSVIQGMSWLVQNDFDVPAMTAAGQLVIMAIGLLWDVLTSGDRWTNGDSPKVPRPARVLLYFGYVSMTVTAILFFKGTGQGGTYDEDQLAILGLTFVGIPLFLYGFARAGVLLVRQAWERQQSA